LVSVEPPIFDVGVPLVTMDTVGNCVAVWTELLTYQGTTQESVQASIKPAGQAWSAQFPVAIPTNLVWLGNLIVDAKGNAVLSWKEADVSGSNLIYVSTLPMDGSSTSWSTARLWRSTDPSTTPPLVQSDDAGNLIAIFYDFSIQSPSSGALWSMAKSSSDYQWGGSGTPFSTFTDPTSPSLASFGDGTTMAVWINTLDNSVWANVCGIPNTTPTPAPSWNKATQISIPSSANSNTAVVFDSNGNAIAVWSDSDGVLNYAIWVKSQSNWTTAQPFAKSGISGCNAVLQSDENGNVIAIWPNLISNSSVYNYQAAILLPDNPYSWNAIVTLEGLQTSTPESIGLAIHPTK
ncbi:MAG: hypothetical protein LLG04_13370, partial [Parachlamydia sp.]|nr:hypothetical protein [Parachlamydia sp.]